jgi:hypothetical protein
MRILREVTALSLAFLSALLPVQEVLGEKVKIGVVNLKVYNWNCSNPSREGWYYGNNISYEIMEFFRSEKGKEAFDSFIRYVKDKYGITKIIDMPGPANFVPNKLKWVNKRATDPYYAFEYLNLKTGEYEPDSFDRDYFGAVLISLEEGSKEEDSNIQIDVQCFEVEE